MGIHGHADLRRYYNRTRTVSPNTWDPNVGTAGTVGPTGLQALVQPDYTLDPTIWDITKTGFQPPQYIIGQLASSYKMPNPTLLLSNSARTSTGGTWRRQTAANCSF